MKRRRDPDSIPKSYWWQVVDADGEIVETKRLDNVTRGILRVRAMHRVSNGDAHTINIIDINDDPLWPKKHYDYFTRDNVKGAHKYIPQEYEVRYESPV